MRLLILYFSGTGNTEYVSSYIEDSLKKSNLSIEVIRVCIEVFPPEKVWDFDLICFGFPIFDLDSPEVVKKYLERIPSKPEELLPSGLFMFVTMGYSAGNAIRRNFKRLERKGFVFLGSVAVKMPGSDGLIMLNEDSKYVKEALERNYDEIPEVDNFIDRIKEIIIKIKSKRDIAQFKSKLPISVGSLLIAPFFKLVYIILIGYLKKRFRVDENCIRCELCVKICPNHNISLIEDEIIFDKKCSLCLRCIHQCPQHAIQIGKYTVNKFRWHGPKGNFKPLKMLKEVY